MEINRKIYKKLLDWKEHNQGKNALLIEGARRIGKTTVAEELGKKEYKSYILIDFNKADKRVFDNYDNLSDLDIFFQNLSLIFNIRLYNRNSLIIFDEVQKFPRAREAIKYLVEDGRYDYIETGSLISIKENVENITIPSEEKKMKMYPLDFEEFASYMGEDLLIEYIRDCYKKGAQLETHFHKQAMRIFKEYMLVGGMPQAVTAYKNNQKDFSAADEQKRLILDLYRDDIRKASNKYNIRLASLFENIPAYLSTHEKRIVFNNIEENGRSSSYSDAVFWLGDSMIVNNCFKCNDPNIGFAFNKNESYVKCYMGDTGLLVSLAFDENELIESRLYEQILNDKLSLNNGMLYENVIAQMIAGKNKQLYFYTRYNNEKKRNDIEIDFIMANGDKTNFKMYPVEVKSSKNYTSISFDKFKEVYKKKVAQGYIVHTKNYSQEGDVIKIPVYMFALCID